MSSWHIFITRLVNSPQHYSKGLKSIRFLLNIPRTNSWKILGKILQDWSTLQALTSTLTRQSSSQDLARLFCKYFQDDVFPRSNTIYLARWFFCTSLSRLSKIVFIFKNHVLRFWNCKNSKLWERNGITLLDLGKNLAKFCEYL